MWILLKLKRPLTWVQYRHSWWRWSKPVKPLMPQLPRFVWNWALPRPFKFDHLEDIMQLAIELPDEMGQQVLQHENVQEFVKRALEKELSAERKINQTEQELFALMAKVPSSVSLVDELIQERSIDARKEREENT
jgi:hypothetical protein